MAQIKVTKRNGSTEEFDQEKIHRIIEWATDGVTGTSISDIEMGVDLNLFDGINSEQIHEALVNAAADLISVDEPNYSKVAARLLTYKHRKAVWGGKHAPRLLDLLQTNIEAQRYHPELMEKYTRAEIEKLGEYIEHDRDDSFEYGGLLQFQEKYLIQDRRDHTIFETPQFAYMGIAMTVFSAYEGKERIKYIRRLYDYASRFKINLPTPIMSGARSTLKSWSSCCLIELADTMDSLMAVNTTIAKATSAKYGIGIDASNLREINSSVRNGETKHAGVIAWLKMFEATIGSTQQGGARRGAATVTFPFFHPEIETIIELKNEQGTHENRVHGLDYNIAISDFFYRRFVKKGKFSLFSPKEHKHLYDLWGTPEFDKAYEQEEKKGTAIKVLDCQEFFGDLLRERLETGRLYVMNIDACNKHSPWVNPVKTSNLCLEILHDLTPEKYTNDPEAEIGVCVLAGTNMLEINSDAEHEKVCDVIVRMLDEVIEQQEYPIKGLENFAKNKRSLGVGVMNLSAFLTSKSLNYDSEEAPQLVSDYFEKQQYYLMKSSCKLAQERGRAPHWDTHSKYALGKTPLDLYNRNVDEFLEVSKMPWDELMSEIKEHGMRNLTLSACMPGETSSCISGSTNGMEPPTSLITKKSSRGATCPILVPHLKAWKNRYQLRDDIKSNVGIIKVVASIVKWLDMAASGNMYANYHHFENGKIPISVLAQEHLTATKYGWKTFYYLNSPKSRDSSVDSVEEESSGCAGGACAL